MKSLFLALVVVATSSAIVSTERSLPSKLKLDGINPQAASCDTECSSQRSRGECRRDCRDRNR